MYTYIFIQTHNHAHVHVRYSECEDNRMRNSDGKGNELRARRAPAIYSVGRASKVWVARMRACSAHLAV